MRPDSCFPTKCTISSRDGPVRESAVVAHSRATSAWSFPPAASRGKGGIQHRHPLTPSIRTIPCSHSALHHPPLCRLDSGLWPYFGISGRPSKSPDGVPRTTTFVVSQYYGRGPRLAYFPNLLNCNTTLTSQRRFAPVAGDKQCRQFPPESPGRCVHPEVPTAALLSLCGQPPHRHPQSAECGPGVGKGGRVGQRPNNRLCTEKLASNFRPL